MSRPSSYTLEMRVKSFFMSQNKTSNQTKMSIIPIRAHILWKFGGYFGVCGRRQTSLSDTGKQAVSRTHLLQRRQGPKSCSPLQKECQRLPWVDEEDSKPFVYQHYRGKKAGSQMCNLRSWIKSWKTFSESSHQAKFWKHYPRDRGDSPPLDIFK